VVLARSKISLRKIASIIGIFTWAIPTIAFAQSNFRRVQTFYIKQARKVGFNLKSECVLSAETRDDLERWSSYSSFKKDKSFFSSVPSLEIFTDASLTGWGNIAIM
jgi:hypothetical protein